MRKISAMSRKKVKLLPVGHQWIGWRWRADHWQRILLAVRLLAETGVSTAQDLLRLLAAETGVSPNARSLRRLVYQSFADEQVSHMIVENRTLVLPGTGKFRLRVMWLSEYGKTLARDLGVEPVESDWEKIARLHRGETQEQHAALVLMAAYQARLRGWTAEVVPFNPQETPWFQPDLKLTDPDGWVYYCEAESRSRVNPDKWARMRQVNLIMPTPNARLWMTQRLKTMGIPGRAADLRTLAQQAKAGTLNSFWLEKW
ncbi:MAG: hypothetical protein HZC39_00090 [Chloroflexi bacterium]|nr:hypothetical protein [Chloroflexota bacterium]MBI5701904.1 hypothetical protein [Chloroflexota bacterium]